MRISGVLNVRDICSMFRISTYFPKKSVPRTMYLKFGAENGITRARVLPCIEVCSVSTALNNVGTSAQLCWQLLKFLIQYLKVCFLIIQASGRL